MSHTPGPWIAQLGHTAEEAGTLTPVWFVSTVDDSPETWEGVAECAFDRPEANARLIAAAPDLLEAAQFALDFHAIGTEAFVKRYGAGATTRDLANRLRAAIAKAEGREP